MHTLVNSIPEPVLFLFKRLIKAHHQVYIVGGAVRDVCLNRQVADWDLATSAPTQAIQNIFNDKTQFTLGHGTTTVMVAGRPYEITTFRGKSNSLKEDLAHRDLTINAMALDACTRQVIDPHQGLKDLRDKVVRAVENPGDRFREDPLRLLRAVRFAAQLDFKIHQKTFSAISSLASLLHNTTPERIREELMKILMVPVPSGAFNTLARVGLLKEFLPELLEGHLKRQNHYHRYTIFKHILETVDHVAPTRALRLTALLHDIAKPRIRTKVDGVWQFHGHEKASAILAGEIMNRLKFSKALTQEVTHLIKHHLIGYNANWHDAAVRRLIKKVGHDHIEDLLTFRKADIFAHGKDNGNHGLLCQLDARIQAQLASRPPLHVADLAIDGRKIIAFTGLEPGPAIGKILAELNEKVLEDPQLNRAEKLEEILKGMKILSPTLKTDLSS